MARLALRVCYLLGSKETSMARLTARLGGVVEPSAVALLLVYVNNEV